MVKYDENLIKQEQKNIDGICLEIGKKYVAEHKDSPDPEYAGFMDKIAACEERINAHKKAVLKANGLQLCPKMRRGKFRCAPSSVISAAPSWTVNRLTRRLPESLGPMNRRKNPSRRSLPRSFPRKRRSPTSMKKRLPLRYAQPAARRLSPTACSVSNAAHALKQSLTRLPLFRTVFATSAAITSPKATPCSATTAENVCPIRRVFSILTALLPEKPAPTAVSTPTRLTFCSALSAVQNCHNSKFELKGCQPCN